MDFGEKLYKLRKEKGFSQEELAEKVNSSRQAISKWENNQGFPETEKLLLLGTIFEVSIDYLLKDCNEQNREQTNGYYLSKEMAYGYILNEKKVNKHMASSIMLLVLSGIPYIFFQDNRERQIIVMTIFIAFAIVIGIIGALKESNKYKVLKQEPLLFDKIVLKELKKENIHIRKKYTIVVAISIFSMIIGITPFLLLSKRFGPIQLSNSYYMLAFILLAIGIFGFIVSFTIIEAYQLLANNEEHANKIHIKIMRKIRKLVD